MDHLMSCNGRAKSHLSIAHSIFISLQVTQEAPTSTMPSNWLSKQFRVQIPAIKKGKISSSNNFSITSTKHEKNISCTWTKNGIKFQVHLHPKYPTNLAQLQPETEGKQRKIFSTSTRNGKWNIPWVNISA